MFIKILWFCLEKNKVGLIPSFNEIESFIVPPQTGINYKIGVWHYPLISLIESNFLVIDRKGPEENLNIYKFKDESIILNHE